MEITCKEIIEEEEHVVSSTETTPVKLSIPKSKGKESSAARMLKVSKKLKEAEILTEAKSIQSASKRAMQLFGTMSKAKRVKIEDPISSESEDDLPDEISEQTSKLRRALQGVHQLKKATGGISKEW